MALICNVRNITFWLSGLRGLFAMRIDGNGQNRIFRQIGRFCDADEMPLLNECMDQRFCFILRKRGLWSRTLIIKARFESIKKSNIPIKVIIVSAAVKKEDRKMLLIKYKNYNDLPLLARWLIFEKGILHAYYIYYYLFRLCSKMSYSFLPALSEAKKSSELDPELMRPGFQAPKYGC